MVITRDNGCSLISQDSEIINPSRHYLKELDVIRFWAFFGVFFYHSIHLLQFKEEPGLFIHSVWFVTLIARAAGRFGVDLFFTLSAFLITTLLLTEKETFGRIQLKKFYLRRILRIWPLYYAFALLMFGLAWLVGEHALAPHFWPFMLLAPNWGWIVLGTPVLKMPGLSALFVFWSLGVEEQFYLLWPLVLRARNRTNVRAVAWTMIGVSLITRVVCYESGLRGPGIIANTFARLDPIAVGILLSAEWMAQDASEGQKSLRHRILASRFTLVAAVFGYLLSGWLLLKCELINDPTMFIYLGYPLVALSGYLIVFNTLLNLRAKSRQGPIFRSLAYLGKVSYGLYVFHGFVLGWVWYWFQRLSHTSGSYLAMPYGQQLITASIALSLSILVSHLSFKYFESYFLAMKDRFSVFAQGHSDEVRDPSAGMIPLGATGVGSTELLLAGSDESK